VNEIWKDIEGFNGIYQISNLGKVKSFKNNQINILKNYINNSGYPEVNLRKNKKKKHLTIHRLIAVYFIDNPNNLPEVNHLDGDKTNYSISNLEWSTHANNIQHAYDTGLQPLPLGEKNSAAKLTEKQVIEIRAIDLSISSAKVAKQYNIGKTAIKDIRARKTWKHI